MVYILCICYAYYVQCHNFDVVYYLDILYRMLDVNLDAPIDYILNQRCMYYNLHLSNRVMKFLFLTLYFLGFSPLL